MQSKFVVALLAALALAACGRADEAAAPAMQQAQEAAGAAEDAADEARGLPAEMDRDDVATVTDARPETAAADARITSGEMTR